MIPLLGTYAALAQLKTTVMNRDIVKVYTDTEITVTHLKNILAENNIESLLKNDYDSGVSAGFVAGTTSSVELYVFIKDQAQAEALVKRFIEDLQK